MEFHKIKTAISEHLATLGESGDEARNDAQCLTELAIDAQRLMESGLSLAEAVEGACKYLEK